MKLGIIGKKVGMTQVFDDNGLTVPVSVIDVSDCFITQVKSQDKDGYSAIQVGFGKKKLQNINKALTGHFKKAEVPAKARTQEIRFADNTDMTQFRPGQRLTASMFEKGDRVDVIGVTKGKGFTGVMKRHNFHGADATHGVHEYFRHGGSAGTNTFPGRILKNKGMPGHHGDANRTVANLEVIQVRPEDNLILVRGAVPGAKNGALILRSTGRRPLPTGRTLTA